MLGPIIYCKVLHARNAYLKACLKGSPRAPEREMRLLDIVGDRHDFYQYNGWHRDAARIVNLAATKKNATHAELALLGKVRLEICPPEKGMG